MKIGILTQPLGINYGGLIQNWALQQVLIRAGHEVVTIDHSGRKYTLYRSIKKHLYPLKCCLFNAFGGKGIVKMGYFPTEKELSVINGKINDFINRHICHTGKLTKSSEFRELQKNEHFDAYVVGSDQCWRFRYNPESLPEMFLSFVKDCNGIKKVAYAVSFGSEEWEMPEDMTNVCSVLARQFDLITVREDSGMELCRKYLGVHAAHVLDPTMLLNTDSYVKLAGRAETHRMGLFTYILDPSDNKREFIQQVASKYNVKPFQILPKYQRENRQRIHVKHHIEDCVYPDVTTWLRAFMNCELAVVDSFHGMVFSILFNVPFWVVNNPERGTARFLSLLKIFHLENRMVDIDGKGEIELSTAIDWNTVNKILDTRRAESLSLLTDALK